MIAAFIPNRAAGPFNLQGLVLFILYAAGIVSAMAVAFLLKRTVMRASYHPLLLELPEYHWPNLRNLLIGLWERTRIFLTRVGTIILSLMIVLWFLSTFPAPPADATGPAIQYSIAGYIGRGLEYLFAPIGFSGWNLARPGAGSRRARGRGRRARHRVLPVGDGRCNRRSAHADDRLHLEPCHGTIAAGLVRVRTAVPVDARGRQARDEFLALSADHGSVSLRALRWHPSSPTASR